MPIKLNQMAKIKLEKSENHIKLVINKDTYNSDFKKDIKKIKSVRVFNAVKLTDKIRISIFPFSNCDIENLEKEVLNKLSHL